MKNIEKLNSDGFFIIKKSLTPKEIEHLLEVVGSIIADVGSLSCTPPIGIQKTIANDPIVNNIHYHSDDFLDLAINGGQIDPIRQVLNDPYYGLIPEGEPSFNLAQCNLRKSSSSLDYHVDVRLKVSQPVGWSIQCIIALEDRHRSNGGLKVIPGSHLLQNNEDGSLDHTTETFCRFEGG